MAETKLPVRDATWDIARGVGMILVIYAHFLEPMYPARVDLGNGFMKSAFTQWQVIYSFHMMLFFMISGAVNRNLPYKPWSDALRASLRLLTLAWVVHLLGALVAVLTGNAPDATGSVSGGVTLVFKPIFEGYYWSVGVLWFLTALCFVQFLAYLSLEKIQPLNVVVGSMAATLAVVYFNAPNLFIFRAWMPGLAFFALGFAFTRWQVRWRWWLCIPLLVAVIELAPLNSGCSFSLRGPCDGAGAQPFGVRMFTGGYGYLPLFFLTSLVGCLGIVTLSAGLSRSRVGNFFVYVGKNSLELFIINGFVATFLPPYIARIHWPTPSVLLYVAILIGVVVLHLAALQLLRPALERLNAWALAIAELLIRLAASIKRRMPAVS